MERIKLLRVVQPTTVGGSIEMNAAAVPATGGHLRMLQQNDEGDNNDTDDITTEDDDTVVMKSRESQFIETCIKKLTPTNNSNEDVSQVQFASFVILYCRHDDNAMIRGPECTSALFFFHDLPNVIQMEFVRYTACSSAIIMSTEDTDMTIEDCLNEYNANGALFYMEDSARVPELCTYTYPLMTSTDLLLTADEIPITPSPMTPSPITSSPIVPTTSVPTQSPFKTITTQQPTAISLPTTTDDVTITSRNGLSTVGMLGITITTLFAIMFCYQMILWQWRKWYPSSKKQNTNMALHEDESFVASEHSHELATTPMSTNNNDGDYGDSRPTLDATLDVVAGSQSGRRKSWMLCTPVSSNTTSNTKRTGTPKQQPTTAITTPSRGGSGSTTNKHTGNYNMNKSNSPHHHRYFGNRGTRPDENSGANVKFMYPSPLAVTTATTTKTSSEKQLSDDNPVHTRKRFQGKKTTGHFSFDEEDVNNNNCNATATTATTTKRNDPNVVYSRMEAPSSNTNHNNPKTVSVMNKKTLNVQTNVKGSEISKSLGQQPLVDPPVRPPIVSQQQQQSGKENSKNNATTRTTGTTTHHPSRQIHDKNKPLSQQQQHQRITAITFGDVIHTELQRETNVAETTRVQGGGPSVSTIGSTILQSRSQKHYSTGSRTRDTNEA